jgi:uncharacterized membrane protein YeaQ/YmgE (transglycosylase-associated protein family)
MRRGASSSGRTVSPSGPALVHRSFQSDLEHLDLIVLPGRAQPRDRRAGVGTIKCVIAKGGGFGLIVDIIVGIVGAVIGGFLAGVLGISTGEGIIGSIIVAFIGAVILLLILRARSALCSNIGPTRCGSSAGYAAAVSSVWPLSRRCV